MACPTVHMSARGYHVRLNCDAHLGVNTAQATRVHVSTCVGACAIEEEHKMRLQGGPPRRVALPRAPRLCACNPLEGPSMCVQLSQPNATAKKRQSPHLGAPPWTIERVELNEAQLLSPTIRDHPFFITPLLRQLQLEVSRSPGCCVHTKWVTRCSNSP